MLKEPTSVLLQGVAAISAGLCSIALIVPSMYQIWYEGQWCERTDTPAGTCDARADSGYLLQTGPIAKETGDIGFEMAFAVAGLLYFPFRTLEIKLTGR